MSATQPVEPNASSPDLDQLVQAGLDLVRLLNRHVEAVVKRAEIHLAADPPEPWPMQEVPHYPADIGMTFSRIARAIRLTKALQVRLAREPRRPIRPREMLDMDTAAKVREAVLRRFSRTPLPTDPDGDIIEPSDGVERLDHEAWENLEDEDTDAEILARPVAEILAIIRRDLSVSSPASPAPAGRGQREVSRKDGGGALSSPPRPSSKPIERPLRPQERTPVPVTAYRGRKRRSSILDRRKARRSRPPSLYFPYISARPSRPRYAMKAK